MQIAAQPKGWSDAEVDQALDSLSSIEQNTANINEWSYVIMDGSTMIVFLLAVFLGYTISAWFMPATTDLGRWS